MSNLENWIIRQPEDFGYQGRAILPLSMQFGCNGNASEYEKHPEHQSKLVDY
jgi:hypothetical protein